MSKGAGWQPASGARGRRSWFVCREVSRRTVLGQVVPTYEYHSEPGGGLLRFGSYATALRRAEQLNRTTTQETKGSTAP